MHRRSLRPVASGELLMPVCVSCCAISGKVYCIMNWAHKFDVTRDASGPGFRRYTIPMPSLIKLSTKQEKISQHFLPFDTSPFGT